MKAPNNSVGGGGGGGGGGQGRVVCTMCGEQDRTLLYSVRAC